MNKSLKVKHDVNNVNLSASRGEI